MADPENLPLKELDTNRAWTSSGKFMLLNNTVRDAVGEQLVLDINDVGFTISLPAKAKNAVAVSAAEIAAASCLFLRAHGLPLANNSITLSRDSVAFGNAAFGGKECPDPALIPKYKEYATKLIEDLIGGKRGLTAEQEAAAEEHLKAPAFKKRESYSGQQGTSSEHTR